MKQDIINLITKYNLTINSPVTSEISIQMKQILNKYEDKDKNNWYSLRSGKSTIKTMFEFIK